MRNLFLALLLLHLGVASAANVALQRVEPSFWWVGMANPKLELLVQAPGIAHYTVQAQYPGVQVLGTKRLASSNYLFVQLQIDASAQPGQFDLVFSLKGKKPIRHPYQLKARVQGSAQRRSFGPEDVIYLITPDRFANGDPTNDSSPLCTEKADRANKDGRHGGDLQGIIDRLDYFVQMGYTALWINPVLENNQPSFSYHGYAITDYYKVDPRFGSNELYQQLASKAAERGLKLIMDQVVNHCGSMHWWMLDMPDPEWINNQGQFLPCNHQRTTLQDPYASAADRRLHTDGWFATTMPDLNQRQEQLATYLIQNSIWWVEYAGLAGIRQDTYPYPDKNFTTRWAAAIRAEYPNLNIVGEEWSVNPVITSYWQLGKQNHDGYQSNLPSVMDFPIQEALVSALRDADSWATGLIRLYQMLANDFLYPTPNNLVIFPDNHDMSRIYTQLGHDYKLWKNAMVYMATLRGIPQLFYGTEILMQNPGTEDHTIIRSDFPGGWPTDSIDAFAAKGLGSQQAEAQAFLRGLLQWRKQSTTVHHGRLMHYAPENDTYVLFRYNDQHRVMVVLNKNTEAAQLDTNRFGEMLQGKSQARNVLTGQTVSLHEPLRLAPGEPLLLEID